MPVDFSEHNQKEKRYFKIFVIFGIFAFGFGFFVLKNAIQSPFRLLDNFIGEDSGSDEQNFDEFVASQNQDTDKDGLSDYDEVYIYNTSPFLDDSDSDGYSDYDELNSGHDPNCPVGEICEAVAENDTALSEDISATELRQMLVDAGVDESELNALSDEELLSAYQQVLTEESIGNEEIVAETNQEVASEDLEELSANEIRQLLLENGADPSVLGQIDDEALRQMFLEILNE